MLKTKTRIIIVVAAALLLLGTVVFMLYKAQDSSGASKTKIPKSGETVNLSPSGPEEAARSNEAKQRIIERDNQEKSTDSASLKQITPVITYAGTYGNSFQVGGYVTVFEEGGNCKATLTRGESTYSKSVSAARNAQSTDCPEIEFKNSEFATKGTYALTLSYTSKTSSGSSDVKQVEIR